MSSAQIGLPTAPPGDTLAERPPLPPALSRRPGFLLAMVKGGAEPIFSEALAPLRLRPKQYGLLTVLASEDSLSQQELANWMRIDRTTMVALIDSLEERDWVKRERNPADRRAYLLRLTPSGKRVQARARELVASAEDKTFASLTREERERLIELLAKVAEDIGRPLPELRP
jgi:DNA-binding MarR family transcriptional regulator